jgi:hypothetical protein
LNKKISADDFDTSKFMSNLRGMPTEDFKIFVKKLQRPALEKILKTQYNYTGKLSNILKKDLEYYLKQEIEGSMEKIPQLMATQQIKKFIKSKLETPEKGSVPEKIGRIEDELSKRK